MIPKTISILLLFLGFIFSFTIANSKVRGVNLAEELQAASIIVPAKIISYDTAFLKFQPLGGGAVISARYSTDPTWNPSRFIHQEWPPKDEKVDLTAEWPPVGAEVLIVTDKENVISIFAWSLGEKYRFWSPVMTGSVAGFNCKSIGSPIDLINPKDDPNTSWDGCLVDKSHITTKGVSIDTVLNIKPREKSSKIFLPLIGAAIIGALYLSIRRRKHIKPN